MLHELRSAAQNQASKVLGLVTVAQDVRDGDSISSLLLDGHLDRAELSKNFFILKVFVVSNEPGENMEGFLVLVDQKEPPRRFGDDEPDRRDNNEEGELESERETPLESVVLVIQRVRYPYQWIVSWIESSRATQGKLTVGNAEAKDVAAGADTHQHTPDVRLDTLRQIDGRHGGDQSNTEAIDEPANDHLGEVP